MSNGMLSETEMITKANICFDNGDYEKAVQIYSEVTYVNSLNSFAFFKLAQIFHMKGDINKAIRAFKRVLELDPDHTDAAVSLSVLYNDIGQYDKAKVIFDKLNNKVKRTGQSQAVEDPHVNKKFSSKHHELADMYMLYNRFDESLFEYRKAIGLDPNNLELRIKVAKVYAKKGFNSKAFEELRKLKNESPNFINGRIALGVLHYSNGQVLEAQSEWQKVMSLDPSNSQAKMYLELSKNATETTIL